ncbi:MAG: PadR family transcriptional regulator [Candidatus Bathyarchaeia archaeon]
MTKTLKDELVQRIFRNFLDIMVLKLVQAEPTWGYKIIKDVKEEHGIKLRHGALYPLLNELEKKGFLKSRKEAKGGRVRKLYEITSKGMRLVNAYHEFLEEQLQNEMFV